MSSSPIFTSQTSDDQAPENTDFSVVVSRQQALNQPNSYYFSTLPPIYLIPNRNLPPPPLVWIYYPFWFTNPNPKWFQFRQDPPLLYPPNPNEQLSHPSTSRRRYSKKLTWKRKIKHEVESSNDQITTVMLRNIPNRYTREMMIEFMDTHCEEANKKEKDEESLISAYDFLYLPIDFKTEMNKGYAFVNFTNAKAVLKFKAACNYKTWSSFGSSKVLAITSARIQGKDELVKSFQRMTYPVEAYSAVCFNPARSCKKKTVQTIMVGVLGSV